jgi:hypothetical protein
VHVISLANPELPNGLGGDPRVALVGEIARRCSPYEAAVARRVEPSLRIADRCEDDRSVRLQLVGTAPAPARTAAAVRRAAATLAAPSTTATTAAPMASMPSPIALESVAAVTAVSAIASVATGGIPLTPSGVRRHGSGAFASIPTAAVARTVVVIGFAAVTLRGKVSTLWGADVLHSWFGWRRRCRERSGGVGFAVRILFFVVHNGA